MKAYTLIEVVLVVAIISLMSLIGMTKFGEFQKDAKLGTSADEFVSTLRMARGMSMAGSIGEGEAYSDFEEDGLPYFGVSVSGNTYEIFREVEYKGAGSVVRETVEKTDLDPDFNLTGSGEIKFERISGDTTGAIFTLENSDITEKMQIDIDSLGNIQKKKI